MSEQVETADSKMIDKIRFLLRKADTSQGTTQAEATSALSKAQELMTKYGISKMIVEDREAEDFKPTFEIVKEKFEVGRSRYEEDSYIARIVVNCFSVQILWGTTWEEINSLSRQGDRTTWSGAPRKVWKKRLVYVIIGDKFDVEVAKVIIVEIRSVMRRLFQDYLKKNGLTWTAISCHSFFEGLTQAYCKANQKQRKETMLESGTKAADKYALVLVDKEKAVEEFVQTIHTVRSRVTGPRSWKRDEAGYAQGQAVGSKIKLGVKKLN